jgi:hypothetical protein
MKSKAVYWLVVILSSALLLWGWSIAVQNLINGTTVVS